MAAQVAESSIPLSCRTTFPSLGVHNHRAGLEAESSRVLNPEVNAGILSQLAGEHKSLKKLTPKKCRMQEPRIF